MKKCILVLAAVAAAYVWGEPQITDVQMIQDRPGRVRLSYHLAAEPAVVTLDVQTNCVDGADTKWASVGGVHLRHVDGAVNRKVEPGEHLVFWNARKDFPDKLIHNGVRAVFTAWATNAPPPYMVINLTKANTDERLSSLRFYADEDSMPYGPVASNRIYKSDLLVMRKIPAAHVQWWMGAKNGDTCNWGNGDGQANYLHQVVLTRDFYLGVFMLTQSQIAKGSGWPAPDRNFNDREDSPYRPTTGCRWVDMRSTTFPDAAKPYGGQGDPGSGSYIAAIAVRTGVRFDLPTMAQWEFAARAGVGDGIYTGKTPLYKKALDPDVDEIAWYKFNTQETREVGLKLPNGFGLYDMLGNVSELCLEWAYNPSSSDATVRDGVDWDPIGPDSGTSRAMKGGSYLWNMDYCRLFSNLSGDPLGYASWYGLRLWAPAEVP